MLGSGYMPGRIGFVNVRSATIGAPGGVVRSGTGVVSAGGFLPPSVIAAHAPTTSTETASAGVLARRFVVHLGTRHPSTGRRGGLLGESFHAAHGAGSRLDVVLRLWLPGVVPHGLHLRRSRDRADGVTHLDD